jgi:AbrB family looped-hinge helix DNA binding protein
MKATIDKAGRIVIPKDVRRITGMHAGQKVEFIIQEGDVLLHPMEVPKRAVRRGQFTFIAPEGPIEPLTDEIIEKTLTKIRERNFEKDEDN